MPIKKIYTMENPKLLLYKHRILKTRKYFGACKNTCLETVFCKPGHSAYVLQVYESYFLI